ncbi:MAG TPA: trypsin-like peptidase domain-containing protein [Enhygromyxa sp.]|nr:trypsin-like peptidase domain-containing protein [Enhygromyxa sp.]
MEVRERETYPFWVAMGAAFVGTLLGGGAVWVGVNHRLQALEQRPEPVVADVEIEPQPEPQIDAEPEPADGPVVDAEPLDPGDSALVRAVEQTRDAVVTLSVGGRVRGAGVVYDESGSLLTNYHVIEPVLRAQQVLGDADTGVELIARFVDGRERAVRVLAADPDEDVAILSLIREREQEQFAAVALGRSAELRLGEQVFAIGSPVGFEGTVATGIVSALQRTKVLSNPQLALIQLDAAINFGNSGGPLFNLAGELVGITTARSSRGEGIGFAIPIDRVRLFLRALYEGKQGRAGMIGVELDAGVAIADRIEPLGYHSGVAVSEVAAEGPAALAGMREGDVIVAIRGRRHDELDASQNGRIGFARIVGDTIRALIPGETLVLAVVRNDAVVDLELTVTAASDDHQASIDAEKLLGLRLDAGEDNTRIQGLIRDAPISRIPEAELLLGAKIISLLGQPVADRAQLGERLASLRAWSASGGRRSIAIGFELADGQRIAASNYPLAK